MKYPVDESMTSLNFISIQIMTDDHVTCQKLRKWKIKFLSTYIIIFYHKFQENIFKIIKEFCIIADYHSDLEKNFFTTGYKQLQTQILPKTHLAALFSRSHNRRIGSRTIASWEINNSLTESHHLWRTVF